MVGAGQPARLTLSCIWDLFFFLEHDDVYFIKKEKTSYKDARIEQVGQRKRKENKTERIARDYMAESVLT
jgi:hypothetical protein